MKRKAESLKPAARKAPRVEDYCEAQLVRDSNGSSIWPAPQNQMMAARAFLKAWYFEHNQQQG